MAKKNQLLAAPPYPVEQTLKQLGNNLHIARLRRNWTIAEIAEKIGTGPRAVSDAEKGKASTGAVVYMALLWALDLIDHMESVADPAKDTTGLRLSLSREKSRARHNEEPDNDF
ncbi:MAG: helix-turn-helix domain-containing protein [Alphaproteobacteria bacterium]|nr:helix-turn-helix domain-containing protein [Alphaproteobacteria bacterium]